MGWSLTLYKRTKPKIKVPFPSEKNKGCVCHITLWQCHLHSKVSQGKRRRIMETQIPISPCKNIHNLQQKNPLKKKEPKSFKILEHSITNLSSFNITQNIIFQKSSDKKIDLLLLLLLHRAQNPLSYYYTL